MTRIERYEKKLDALWRCLVAGDATAKQLAKKFKVSMPTIYSRLKKLPVVARYDLTRGPASRTGPRPVRWGVLL